MLQHFIGSMQAEAKETGKLSGQLTEAAIKAYLQRLDGLSRKVIANGYQYNEDLFYQALSKAGVDDANIVLIKCYQGAFKFIKFAHEVKDLDVIAEVYGIKEKVAS